MIGLLRYFDFFFAAARQHALPHTWNPNQNCYSLENPNQKSMGELRIGRTAHLAHKRITPRRAQLFSACAKVAQCAWRTFRVHWCCEKEVSKLHVFGKFQSDLKSKVK